MPRLATGQGQRSGTFRFRLVSGATGLTKGYLNPLTDSVPQLQHDLTRTIPRLVTNLELGPTDAALVDPVGDRVWVSMLLGGREYPLGRYTFIDSTEVVRGRGDMANIALVDEMFVIDQPMSEGFATYQTSGSVTSSIERLLERYPTVSSSIEQSPLLAAGSWGAGTSGARVLQDLAQGGGYLPPWFDNNGILRAIQGLDLGGFPDIDWDESNTILLDSITKSNDLINAPNRIIVVSNGGLDLTSALVGIYDVPFSAPHSLFNRGYLVSAVFDIQAASVTEANAAAKIIGTTQTIFEHVSLETAPDPEHDGNQIIRWQGVNWLETGWTLDLIEGGTMSHTLIRNYE